MPQDMLTLEVGKQVEVLSPETLMPDWPLFILAHGAGNDMHSPFLSTIAGHLQDNQINVLRFNFPYKVAGKKMPDHSEVLENAWRLVISWARKNMTYHGMFIGGKSMGGRIASIIAGDVEDVSGLVFLGYPLHPPGKFDRVRDAYLYPLRLPMLFIQGTRDAFARMDLLQQTLNGLRHRPVLHWIEGGDHSFKVLVRSGQSYPEILKNVSEVVTQWIMEVRNKG